MRRYMLVSALQRCISSHIHWFKSDLTRRRIFLQFFFRPRRARHKTTAAIRTYVFKNIRYTIRTESAFITAYHRFGGLWR